MNAWLRIYQQAGRRYFSAHKLEVPLGMIATGIFILDKEELLPSDYDNVTYPLTELGWELGKEINPMMYSAKEWQNYKNSLFYKNVEKEGIKLWG